MKSQSQYKKSRDLNNKFNNSKCSNNTNNKTFKIQTHTLNINNSNNKKIKHQ